MDWRHVSDLLAAGKQVYDAVLNLCVWVKNAGGMGSFYRSRHESVFVFKNGKGKHRNNVQLGQYGRNRTNVWEYPGINTLSKQSDEGNLLALHPTVKPVALIADALLDCSARGDVVLDSFLGSGSTLIAVRFVEEIPRKVGPFRLFQEQRSRVSLQLRLHGGGRWIRTLGPLLVNALTSRVSAS